MLTLESRVHVPGIRGRQLTDFLTSCDDAAYQRWWPGTHLHYRVRGDRVFMDEYVGRRRLRFTGVMSDLVPGKRLVWSWKGLAQLVLEFEDDAQGVQVTHTLHAGFGGIGRLLDPLFRIFFTADSTGQCMFSEHLGWT